MKDCKFKKLILDIYQNWKTNNFTKNEFNHTFTYNNFFGFLYNATSTDSLDNIIDINSYLDIANPDMLFLHSRITNEEIEIYQWHLKDYTIKNNILDVFFTNGKSKKFKL